MTRTSSCLVLAWTVALAGCLPQLRTAPSDSGVDPDDAGADVSVDVSVDDAQDATEDTRTGCDEISNPTEWCAEQNLCGSVARADGCPDIECGDTCQAVESCTMNVCACDPAQIAKACQDAENTCGPLIDDDDMVMCGGRVIQCDACTGFQTCDGESCKLKVVETSAEFLETLGYQLGSALAYRAGTLLMSSAPTGLEPSDVSSVDLETRRVEFLSIEGGNDKTSKSFGVSIDARGDHAIVGSTFEGPFEDENPSMGAARTYTFMNGSWTPMEGGPIGGGVLLDPERIATPDADTSPDDYSVRVAVDYPYFAASAPKYNPDPNDATLNLRGRVHLWRHDVDDFVVLDRERVNPGAEELDFHNAQYGSSLELGGGMLFVGSVKTAGRGGTVCGSVSVFLLDEVEDGELMQRLDLRDEDCMSFDASVRRKTLSSHFGQAILFDDDQLFVVASQYPEGTGQGAVYVYDYDEDAANISDRFSPPKRLDLPPIDGLTFTDPEWSMTRAGNALVLGQSRKGLTVVTGVGNGERSLLRNEGVIAILRKDDQGDWGFDTYWNPGKFKGETYEFGAAVAGTPDGRVFVSAPAANAPFVAPNAPFTARGVVLELDLTRP